MAYEPIDMNTEEWENFTGYHEQFNAIYTVQLGELIEIGLFDWSKPELDWSAFAYDEEQYTRVCDYFKQRFYYREISIIPFGEWANYLHYKLCYELSPKYKPLYEMAKNGLNPLADGNEYYKNRTIQSAYPETLLSENSDYITDGKDEEYQRIKEGNFIDNSAKYYAEYRAIDAAMLDELESMFISVYTLNVNATW
jgi:hypothetical protein